ncbi:MAG: argininosuccinate synthase [Deltaproteobacteria bacterium]|uniref:Argininosuccinate synthase n=1 Tax=Candidatus Zymogenus saltonus TaxID=2844893 RepID=A0A9D8KE69_9DELT|nr:argininosuccinate synthase [Candidatus Zymogenus saltonus]
MADNTKKVVVAYSGGLDTSVILKWIKENYGAYIIAFAADVGQGKEELEGLKEKALKTGADKVYVDDLKEEFVSDYVYPMLRANAVYEGTYLLGTSIARPLIAKRQIEIAIAEGAGMVCHGCTGKGNDQVRFEMAYLTLKPDIQIISPWREWEFKSRVELMEYSEKHKIPIVATAEKPYSTDRNLFHMSFEGGILEDPWKPPPAEMFKLTKSPADAPDKVTTIEIDYDAGNPVAIDGRSYTPAALLTKLNEIGGENGVGRVDMVENRYVGMKSRGVYETPGGTILQVAHRAVESITMDREVMHLRDSLIPKYSNLIYNGYWFSPERELLQGLIDDTQEDVTGKVRLDLYKGNVTVTGRKSETSLYHGGFATFDKDSVYSQKDATGFIRLNALRMRIRAMLQSGKG